MQVRTRCIQSLDYEVLCRVHDAALLQEMKIGGVEKYFIPFQEAPYWYNFFDSEIRIVEVNNEFAGFAAYKPLNLAYFYIDPQFQRRGLVDQLLASVLPTLRRLIRVVVLTA